SFLLRKHLPGSACPDSKSGAALPRARSCISCAPRAQNVVLIDWEESQDSVFWPILVIWPLRPAMATSTRLTTLAVSTTQSTVTAPSSLARNRLLRLNTVISRSVVLRGAASGRPALVSPLTLGTIKDVQDGTMWAVVVLFRAGAACDWKRSVAAVETKTAPRGGARFRSRPGLEPDQKVELIDWLER